ncbi:uracil-xanthine permease family protein [Faecalibacillus intestinalis]|uniref:uracil-xanthine permease family protein n=1 Tax=Faecalibacillus intestinalis TaxID=1982626 RepID=UPI00351F81AD
MENLYKLDGKVPILKAIPFGLQHILAMFVANLSPITLIGLASSLKQTEIAFLLQNAMFIAGIVTLIQLYPIWKIGPRLPIVMSVSFNFVAILTYVGATYGYASAMGAVLIGGLIEGCLGLLARYWKKIITPIVAASVVTSIGFSLFSVGTRSFGGGYSESFGSAKNLLLGIITLATCLLFNIFAKSYSQQLSVLFYLIVGNILAIFMGKVDLSVIFNGGLIALSHLLPFKMKFDLGAIIAVVVIFLVSATETIGDTSALVNSGLNREVTEEEISDSLACDGFCSSISSLFGCPPITSFSQNVSLINITKVVNRFTIATGAICMILVGLLPPIGNFFSSLPESVLGGGTIMMFGTILTSGIEMIAKAGFNQRNVTIVALSLAAGIGFTSGTEVDIWHIFPQIIQDVFAGNCVAVVFVVSIILSLVLPKDMDIKKIK